MVGWTGGSSVLPCLSRSDRHLVWPDSPPSRVARPDLNASLKESGGRSGTGLRHNKYSPRCMVVTEIALAVILSWDRHCFIRTQIALSSVDPGFDATNVDHANVADGSRFLQSAVVEQIVRGRCGTLFTPTGVTVLRNVLCPAAGRYGLPFIMRAAAGEGPFHGGGGWLTVPPAISMSSKFHQGGRAFTDRDDGRSPASRHH